MYAHIHADVHACVYMSAALTCTLRKCLLLSRRIVRGSLVVGAAVWSLGACGGRGGGRSYSLRSWHRWPATWHGDSSLWSISRRPDLTYPTIKQGLRLYPTSSSCSSFVFRFFHRLFFLILFLVQFLLRFIFPLFLLLVFFFCPLFLLRLLLILPWISYPFPHPFPAPSSFLSYPNFSSDTLFSSSFTFLPPHVLLPVLLCFIDNNCKSVPLSSRFLIVFSHVSVHCLLPFFLYFFLSLFLSFFFFCFSLSLSLHLSLYFFFDFSRLCPL